MMKPMIYSAAVAMLVLSSCSSAYKTAQTPDDVYYSPSRPVYAANNQRQASKSNVDQDSERYVTYDDNGRSTDTYVTYEDSDEEKYDYARRMDRFNRPYSGSYWDNYYYDDFYYGSPRMYGMYGSSMMYSPYAWGRPWGSSFGMSLGWGMGGFYGGYSPYSAWGWGSPYSSFYYGSPYSYWGGGYGGWGNYYGGGWGYPGYYHGGGAGYKPRPANSWGPRGSSSSVIYGSSNGGRITPAITPAMPLL
ncbi:hypothetical protein MKQ70_14675 [Chitinophaga sedimenti]|uniref:hypothetical protein n=1 Tax=Chitinophaga sedimenti TaxID=2033606 RepID=UPI00200386EA|nr:hypothetical protein [Chitinophaga sedimenti]MCK7556192.1 hypothetical protein [Chitinophaga sedimenti]